MDEHQDHLQAPVIPQEPYPAGTFQQRLPRKPYPSVGGAFGLLGILLGVSFIGGALLGMLNYFIPAADAPGFMMIYLAAFTITLWIGLMFRRDRSFSWKSGRWYLWPLVLIFTVAFLIIREPVLQLFNEGEAEKDLISGLDAMNPFMLVVSVLAAPLFEELIFRGVILEGFLKRYRPGFAILMSSVIFGIAHVHPLQFVNALLLGLVMGWLYWKTRSLPLTIMLHFVNNLGASFLSWKFTEPGSGVREMAGSEVAFLVLFLFSLLLVFVTCLIVPAYLKTRPPQKMKLNEG